ncbi:hypothetical protein C5706_23535, partial [Klebsiella pneumoniae]
LHRLYRRYPGAGRPDLGPADLPPLAGIGYIGAIPALAGLIWALLIFRRWPVSLEEHQPHHS